MTELLLREQYGRISRLVLNDVATRNSLSLEMIDALGEALASEKGSVIILAANGPVFSSGHNLREITAHRNDRDGGKAFYDNLFERCSELMMQIGRHQAAIIAEVGGLASAAGCQLVASCDLAIAGDSAGFCTPGVNIGLFCSTPMVALSRTVSRKHAMQMLLTGEVVDAEEARRIGLVNKVVGSGDLKAATLQLAEAIARKSPEAIRIGKQAFAAQSGLALQEAYAETGRVMAENLLCEDAKEGIEAFLEKRAPAWPSH